MTGDRDACLAAGADGYVAKPIDSVGLFHLIELLTGSGGAVVPRTPTPRSAPVTEPAFDMDELIARVDGDRALLLDLVTLFRAEAPQKPPRRCPARGRRA